MTVVASSGGGARFIFDTIHDIAFFLGEQSKKREESVGTPFLVLLLDAKGWGRGGVDGLGMCSYQVDSFLFLTNPKDEPQSVLLLKHFRQHKRFNASTMDELCNDGAMKIYHLLKPDGYFTN
ncbi:hypothetical protein CDAR_292301 [Caerostris darwini]|uniref:Uncharacterized protein n=1 Tax=Caerostris darwini TaxID=1538125 RepID=A0AAV4UD62_9ARAC|nr:hypothetical protein CDAR_292301 [Caerostris darwini]